MNRENEPNKKDASFISFSGDDSNTSNFAVFRLLVSSTYPINFAGFSMTSESQGPVDFASSHLMASEDSNSLYEPGAKRMKTD